MAIKIEHEFSVNHYVDGAIDLEDLRRQVSGHLVQLCIDHGQPKHLGGCDVLIDVRAIEDGRHDGTFVWGIRECGTELRDGECGAFHMEYFRGEVLHWYVFVRGMNHHGRYAARMYACDTAEEAECVYSLHLYGNRTLYGEWQEDGNREEAAELARIADARRRVAEYHPV